MSLRLLAEHLRDGTWLDIRTDEGPIQRVRIFEIVVRLAGEDVTLFQQWFDEDDHFQKRWFAVDAEAIWKTAPTACELSDVIPYRADVGSAPVNAPQEQELLTAVLKSALTLWTLTLDELRAVTNWKLIKPRYACLIVLYEMSNLESKVICEALGYQSVQPLVSARNDISSVHHPVQERIDAAKALGKLVDKAMACKCRTARAFPRGYKPVLT